MAILSLLGLGTFLVVSFVVGLRLLRRAFRTLQVPEFAAGSAFFLSGGVGYSLVVAGRVILDREPPLAVVFYAAGLLALDLGVACLALFVWRVFRPGEWIGAVVFTVVVVGLAITYLGTAFATHFLAVSSFTGWEWVGSCMRLLCFVWTGAESVRLRMRLLRRRDAAAARLASRVGGWAVAAFCAGGILAVFLVRRLFGPLDLREPLISITTAILGIASAAAIWRAFGDDEDLDIAHSEAAETSGTGASGA
jgi:hypothetical protein